jgi:prephenate dehydrogenase
MPLFRQVTIVGLGLIGGSLGMAIRRRRLAARVVGVSRRSATLRQAKARGAIDTGTTDARRAVAEADLVVLATPVDLIVPQAKRLLRWMRPGALLTDAGSTKARVVAALDRRWARGIRFVGAHPLAGSERRGIQAAEPRLFDGSVCILTPTGRTDQRALARLSRFWRAIAGRVMAMSPQEHDRALAAASHLPHLLAYALAGSIVPSLPRAPRSFLEMTRIAKSDPDLWDDIFLSNRRPLLASAARFDRGWRRLRSLIRRGQAPALRRRLARAQSRRNTLHD